LNRQDAKAAKSLRLRSSRLIAEIFKSMNS